MVRYDRNTNVFNLRLSSGREKQIPGTSNTLKCSGARIRLIEEFLYNEFIR